MFVIAQKVESSRKNTDIDNSESKCNMAELDSGCKKVLGLL